ncbi:phosphatase PAP2 family protein [Streptomyces griseorubiginosus]|uniref:phosphatase PAP2 family protein n=1 Tax=Streptomyces griseorubiginosus TaxID=67304 RepID=UPI002E80D342|nr:phosphatase PAP2 family protein [Streptomyces griseorubiginosus]
MPSTTRSRPQVSSFGGDTRGSARRSAMRRALREVALVAALFLVYKFGRLAVDGNVGDAFQNAESVWHWERMLRLPSERHVQGLLLDHEAAIRAANGYYAWVHFPATALFLLWLYCRRPAHYRWIRNVMVLLTGSALLLHLVAPLAPPRMLARAGMTDTAHVWGPAVYGDPHADAMANQYAAMPSLHVGWAVVVAVALIVVSRGGWRWLWLAHPIVTVLVVVATANHYWLDGVVACVLVAGAFCVVRRPRCTPRPPARRTRVTEAGRGARKGRVRADVARGGRSRTRFVAETWGRLGRSSDSASPPRLTGHRPRPLRPPGPGAASADASTPGDGAIDQDPISTMAGVLPPALSASSSDAAKT